MGLFATLKSLPILLLVAAAMLLVANVLHLIAFCTTAWGETFLYLSIGSIDPTQTYINYGLWRICTGTEAGYTLGYLGTCSDSLTGTASGWMAAVQAFACLALIGLFMSMVLVVVYIMIKSDDDYLLLAAILCIVTGIFYLIGIIIYGAEFNKNVISSGVGKKLGWSFGLAAISMILEIAAGVLLIVGRKKSTTSPA